MRKSARLVSLIVLLASALPIQLSAQANDPRNGNWKDYPTSGSPNTDTISVKRVGLVL